MVGKRFLWGLLGVAVLATPVGASALFRDGASRSDNLPPYLQCVPYARRVTGIAIYGDAYTWWGQANGRYAKGSVPKVGAVMSFRAGGSSRLGHVAAVSKIVDSRTVLISHANWSPINGRRGQIEKNVEAIDVSPNNDWSQVRVWYAPIKALGGRRWALDGFIYNKKPGWKPGKAEKPDLVEDIETKADKPKKVKIFAAASQALSDDALLSAKSAKRGRISADFGTDPIGEIIARKHQTRREKTLGR
jgi:surface antigen